MGYLISQLSLLLFRKLGQTEISLTYRILLTQNLLLTPSTKESIPRICVSQTILSLTNFIETSNNIYDIKCALYKNIFYDESNDTNLIP